MNERKLELLREALPYIQKFKGKTFVVKFSGKVTENKENLASLAEELALLHQVGIKLCVIHGGEHVAVYLHLAQVLAHRPGKAGEPIVSRLSGPRRPEATVTAR